MAGYISLYLIIDDFFDNTPYQIIVSYICNEIRLILCDSDLDKREDVPRMIGYVENVVPRYLEEDYKSHFRISKTVVELIVERLGRYLTRLHGGGLEQITPYKQILIFLWYMANQDSMREIGQQFGVGTSTVHDILKKVFKVFIEGFGNIICWPDHNEQHQISMTFQLQSPLPGIIGALDGTHIRLASCPGGDNDYINRKSFPSMQLQIVSDCDLMIRHCYTGWPGSTHDSRVLRNSSLIECGELNQRMIAQDKFLLADSAYPLRKWLITPFKDNGRLTVLQKRFNRVVSSSRQVVERCIGHMKGRFRRLREITLHHPQEIVENIVSGCILHNLCMLNNDFIEHYIDDGREDGHPNQYPNVYNNAVDGVLRRQQLMNNLP